MRQPLFQAGEADLGYQQARLGREMAAAYVLSARQQLLFQVTQAYFGLQLAQENLRVVQQAQATAAEHLKIAQARYRDGSVVKADVLSAEVHLARLTQEEMTAASQVQIAQSALGTVMGRPGAGNRDLAPAPKEPAPLPPQLDGPAADGPGEAAGPQTAGVGGPGGPAGIPEGPPQLSAPAEGGGGIRRGSAPPLRQQRRQLHGHGPAQLQPLQRPGRPGPGQGARAKETQAREFKRELEDRVRHQVTESILNLKTAHERLKVARAAVAHAREGLRLIRLRYEEGLTILVDLLTAEDALKNAELGQVTALFDTYLAQAGLDLALGTISGPAAESEAVGATRRVPWLHRHYGIIES